ncbi:centromere-associated protein E isoform X2 [Phyllopteryx taeniolatus]|uniref:centromere-associated protein E isoform X2 n=1 Tax=Phyllopteryx taeniolatus TaxID=161469 RepID=UPI002AD4C5BE|nr:centromere-associated protein E isoform X2 [Phyllopteryx taeniolatus]
MAEESAVKVCIRVRPINREESDPSQRTEPDQVFWKANKKLIQQIDDGNSTKSFSFDRVFTAEETTNQLYQDIAKPLVVSTVEGYNGTIFAYGQTASGKTFTMMGSNHIPGVIPLAIDDVFQTIKKCPKKEFLLRVSYMEIYNETVTDLLVDSWKRKPLEVRETTNKNIYVADLTEELVTSPAQALGWIRKGEKNRHYGMTKMNQRSSRSHTIFRMILESRERSDLASGENADGAIIVSHLNLVDLAGSERASQTGAEGTRLKEGCNINRSLFTLGQVIKKLSEESPSGFINYRDSKLTRILQNSLGGNAKTVILCTITTTFLDETLRTLQFACTAKKMKNDPHVTEVSDDGALLKRYRNEIVDLKRRLQEVSLVTQTTATEREVLSQLLQEKEQLQGEQADRIRNLTKLLVTSTNLNRVQKVPKRRVTWGGKMAPASTSEGGLSDLSFACSVSQKRKASCVIEAIEEDEEFDTHWEIPEEPFDDTNSSDDFVTLRSFGNRSVDRVAELELQLQTLDQQNQQALDQIQTMDEKAADFDLKLKSEAQQKAEAIDKIELLELSVAELKKQLEEQSQKQCEFDKQMGRDFAETVQLCEILATEKDMLASERDYLKQEMGIFMEQTQILEKERAAISQELEENRELEEFKSLEKKFGKELERELQDEICSLKKALESHDLQCSELKKNLETVSEELMRKTKIADDLQDMFGKDLAQEVAKLHRSLDDAEGLGRETKKEWAFLRSENIGLKELKNTLTVSHEKMEAEVNSLRFQLESEKSKFRKMQIDLQKELNVVFNENTKLTTLLDGKVPRNMMDNVELERTVINLKKELTASQEAEGVLRSQLDELRSIQAHPNEVNNLEKIAAEEMEKRESEVTALTAERDQIRMDLQENIDMMIENQEDLRTAHGKIVALKQRIKQLESSQTAHLGKPIDDMTAEIETLQTQREQLQATLQVVSEQKTQLEAELQRFIDEAAVNQSLLYSLQSQLEDQIQKNNDVERMGLEKQAQLEHQVEESQLLLHSLQDDLEDMKQKNCNLVQLNEEEFNLKQSIKILSVELETVKAERDGLCVNKEGGHQTSMEETQTLICRLTLISEERDQLLETVEGLREEKIQLRTEVEETMKSQSQPELRLAQDKIVVLQEEVDLLRNGNQDAGKFQELQNQIQRLSEELEFVVTERDHVQSEMEKLMCQVTCLSEERNQLQDQLEVLGQETSQLSAELEAITGTYQLETEALTEKCVCVEADKIVLLAEKSSTDELEKLTCRVLSLSEERAMLQKTLEILSQEKNELAAKLEDVAGTYKAEKMHLLEKLALAEADKDALLAEKESGRQSSAEELEELTCKVNSLSEERAQLQETLEIFNQEKNELAVKLEDVTGTYQAEKMHLLEKFELAEAEKDVLLAEKESRCLSSAEELEKLTFKGTSPFGERGQLQETLEILNQEKNELATKLEDVTGTYEAEKMHLLEKLALAKAERDALLAEKESGRQSSAEELEELTCKVNSLSGERAQLQETLEILNQEKNELATKLEDVTGTYEAEKMHLLEKLALAKAERDALLAEKESGRQSSAEELEELTCKVNSLSGERAQLQETLEILNQEKNELAAKLEDVTGTYQAEKMHLLEKFELVEAEKDVLLAEKESRCLSSAEELEELTFKGNSPFGERAQLQETLKILNQEKNELAAKLEDVTGTYEAEKMHLLEKLALAEADKDALLAEKESGRQSSAEELEELTCKVNSLSEERAQLQETLQILNQEKNELAAKLEDVTGTYQAEKMHLLEKFELAEAEKDVLLAEKESRCLSSAEELEELTCKVYSLSGERAQLQETLEILNQEKNELAAKLEDVTGTYQAEKMHLLEKLALAEAAKENRCQNSAEELQKLTCSLMSLSGERAQLQEILEELEHDNKQIRTELQDKMSMISAMQEKLIKQNNLNLLQEAEKRKLETSLQQELLTEAKATISELNEKLRSCDQNMTDSKVTASSRLHESTLRLEELFGRFQQFIDSCIEAHHAVKEDSLRIEYFLNDDDAFPQATNDAHKMVCGLGHKNFTTLFNIIDALLKKAKLYRIDFRQLVEYDVSSFEEWRLQDVLQCRSQAPSFTLKDLDCCSGQGHRLSELVQKRQFYMQKMNSILENLWEGLDSYRNEHSAEVQERARFFKQVQDEYNRGPVVVSRLDRLFRVEGDGRSAVSQRRTMICKSILDEWKVQDQELQQLSAQAQRQWREEKNKRVTLQQILEEPPARSEQSLLGNNQQPGLLSQSEEKVKAKQQEEDELKANSCVSDHMMVLQRLKTELLSSQAQVEELNNTIKTLNNQLQESEKRASPCSAELQKVQTQLFKMQLELNAASDKHQHEIQKMTVVLNMKEESVRKLKEKLRTLQQQGEESFLQGEELHDRLLNPRSVVSRHVLRDSKLEEEVKRLQIQIGHLENVISSQQADLAKWKNRAVKLKSKAKRDVQPSPPHTPTKQGLCAYPDPLLQSPKKFLVGPQKVLEPPITLLDSPKIPLLDSPKSKFFDIASNADLLARTYPRQFFDNSSLGTTADANPDESCSQPPRPDCITQ